MELPDEAFFAMARNVQKMLEKRDMPAVLPSEAEARDSVRKNGFVSVASGDTKYVILKHSSPMTKQDSLKQILRATGVNKKSSTSVVLISFTKPSSNISRITGRGSDDPVLSRVSFADARIFVFDREHHALVRKHEIVPPEEVAAILENIGREKQHLPVLLESDPGAVFIGAKKGDVVKIHRVLTGRGKGVVYRRVE